jgi:hypothetical protein
MDWAAEKDHVYFVFGMVKNAVLDRQVEQWKQKAESGFAKNGEEVQGNEELSFLRSLFLQPLFSQSVPILSSCCRIRTFTRAQTGSVQGNPALQCQYSYPATEGIIGSCPYQKYENEDQNRIFRQIVF